ncbi:hypothetical protein ACWGB8_02540 [Kitasatospora sp. NPDC054939]
MTTRQVDASAAELLDRVLAELLDLTDQGDALDSAIVAAVESAALIAVAAEEARRDTGGEKPVELARQALSAVRASVTAATVAVRTLDDRRRALAGPRPVH